MVTSIQGVLVVLPSKACAYTLNTENVYFINVNSTIIASESEIEVPEATSPIETEEAKKEKLASEAEMEVSIEVIRKGCIVPMHSNQFSGKFDEVLCDTFSALNMTPERVTLASNIFVVSRRDLLRSLFEERLAMNICVSESGNLNQIRYIKF